MVLKSSGVSRRRSDLTQPAFSSFPDSDPITLEWVTTTATWAEANIICKRALGVLVSSGRYAPPALKIARAARGKSVEAGRHKPTTLPGLTPTPRR